MRTPSVCAILLTADRPEFTRQAVECFRRQKYANKRLLIFDSGSGSWYEPRDNSSPLAAMQSPEFHIDATGLAAHLTIGELRNFANAGVNSEIIIHWDSDDYSHPNRISEQVALLQRSGADVVGYNEMLFWREPVYTSRSWHCNGGWTKESLASFGVPWPPPAGWLDKMRGEAWLYSCPNPNYALGTSFCMWRSAWERKPFEATSQGEDERWLRGMKSVGESSIGPDGAPRLVARIHAGNTSTAYSPAKMNRAKEWQRVPDRDEELRRLMEVA